MKPKIGMKIYILVKCMQGVPEHAKVYFNRKDAIVEGKRWIRDFEDTFYEIFKSRLEE